MAGVLFFFAGRLGQDARRFAREAVDAPVVAVGVVPATARTNTVYELTYRVAPAAEAAENRTEAVPVALWEAASASGRVRLKAGPNIETRIWRPASTTAIAIMASAGLAMVVAALAIAVPGVRRSMASSAARTDSPGWGARLLGRVSFWTLFGSIWLTVGLPFVLLAGYFAWVDWRLSVVGRTTTGLVLVKEVARSGSGPRGDTFRYSIRYRFEAEGRVREGLGEVREATWTLLTEREPVSIEYVPGRSWLHRIGGTTDRGVLALFGGIGVLISGAGALIVRADWRRRRRVNRLRATGVRELATVVRIDPLKLRVNGTPLWRIRYEYRHASHGTRLGATYVTAEEASRWSRGDRAAILVDPADPGASVWVGEAAESSA